MEPFCHVYGGPLLAERLHSVEKSLCDVVELILDIRQRAGLVKRRYLLASPGVMFSVE